MGKPTRVFDLWLYFLGYFLLGAWVREWQPSRATASVAIAVAVLSIIATALFVGWALAWDPAWATWAYSSQGPFTVLATLAVLTVLLRYATPSPGWLPAVAALTFGVYLIHPMVLGLISQVVPLLQGPLPMPAAYLTQMGLVLLASIGITLVAQRLPGLKRLA